MERGIIGKNGEVVVELGGGRGEEARRGKMGIGG